MAAAQAPGAAAVRGVIFDSLRFARAASAVVEFVDRRAADAAPPDSVAVELEWEALEFTEAGMRRAHHTARADAPVGEAVRLCGPPPSAQLRVRATALGRDAIPSQLRLPSRGIAFVSVLLPPAVRAGAGSADDTLRFTRAIVVSVTDAGGRPIAGAIVRGTDGTGTLTSAQGRALLRGMPEGSADIDIRAIGYAPARRTVVALAPGARDTATVALARTELDTVRVTARRGGVVDLEGAHRLAFGRWVIYAEDIEKRGAYDWMDAVSAIPDVKVGIYRLRDGSRFSIVRRLEMRFPFGKCTPTIWLDGVRMRMFEGDWDLFVPLDQVRRIDVYASATAPMRLREAGSQCGAVLITTAASIPPPVVTPPGRDSHPLRERCARRAGDLFRAVG